MMRYGRRTASNPSEMGNSFNRSFSSSALIRRQTSFSTSVDETCTDLSSLNDSESSSLFK